MINFAGKIACFCLIVAYTFSSSGAVLCHGNDGHVTVEIAFHEHCHGHSHEGESEQEHHDSEDGLELSSECNPCTDIPLTSDVFGDFGVKNVIHINKSALNTITLGNNPPSLNITDLPSSAYSAFFIPLKTIVLLT